MKQGTSLRITTLVSFYIANKFQFPVQIIKLNSDPSQTASRSTERNSSGQQISSGFVGNWIKEFFMWLKFHDRYHRQKKRALYLSWFCFFKVDLSGMNFDASRNRFEEGFAEQRFWKTRQKKFALRAKQITAVTECSIWYNADERNKSIRHQIKKRVFIRAITVSQ